MIYLKKFLVVMGVAVIGAVVAAVVGHWVFEGDWLFLPVLALVGAAMALVQKEKKSYKFIDKLLVGCLVFGFLGMFLVCLRMYLILHPVEPTMPLIFNKDDYLMLSGVFAFVSFMGGLVGIVMKGFYLIIKRN